MTLKYSALVTIFASSSPGLLEGNAANRTERLNGARNVTRQQIMTTQDKETPERVARQATCLGSIANDNEIFSCGCLLCTERSQVPHPDWLERTCIYRPANAKQYWLLERQAGE